MVRGATLAAAVVLGATWHPLLYAAPGLLSAHAGLELVRPDPRVAFARGEGFAPAASRGAIEWSGQLSIERSDRYRFFVPSGSLWIGGTEVGAEHLRLEAGRHAFRYRLEHPAGPSEVFVDWEGPGFLREPIPPRLFSHEPRGADLRDGRQAFEDLGCSNCHESGSPSIAKREGPVLTGLGGRVQPEWIRRWLDAPEDFRSWATMPQLLQPSERADVSAFLASQRGPDIEEPEVRDMHSERGRTTFQSFGCVACHGSDLPLAGMGSKMTVGRLRDFLLDPIRFSPDGRMPTFHLSRDEALELAAYLALSRNEAFERPLSDGDIDRGREIVASSGCLACHALEGLDLRSTAPPLDALDPSLGCMAEEPAPGIPAYRLEEDERAALRRFIASYRESPDNLAAPTFDLTRRLRQLRCHACHEIDGQAPTGSLAEAAPALTGVGRKLQRDWIERVVSEPTVTLDWQELRMPGFGPSHAAWLADTLAKASGVLPDRSSPWTLSGDAGTGLDRLGVDGASGGMGCIGCHGWGEYPALGENGPDLRESADRLRPGWFRRWMRDPARILAGTSMPSYFGGVESSESLKAIGDFWAAFRAASELPAPFGFKQADAAQGGESTPTPVDRPIVVRWDMPEATPAAISVGFPGGFSYCFDAGESRLLYAWRGGFVDLAPTLLTKKNRETNLTETARVIGDVFFREGDYPLRVGAEMRIPQRRFKGYRLIDSVPEFRYEIDGVRVFERIVPSDRGFVRKFRLEGVVEPLRFVPAENEGVAVRSTLEGDAIPVGESVEFEVTVAEMQ